MSVSANSVQKKWIQHFVSQIEGAYLELTKTMKRTDGIVLSILVETSPHKFAAAYKKEHTFTAPIPPSILDEQTGAPLIRTCINLLKNDLNKIQKIAQLKTLKCEISVFLSKKVVKSTSLLIE